MRSRVGSIGVGEWRPLLCSFFAFLLLLASYYLLRPVRDALAVNLGSDSIKYLSSAVFFVMLLLIPIFGWCVARVSGGLLVPGTYAFFIINLGIFAMGFSHTRGDGNPDPLWAAAFYVWVTVFNLFAVSVFWSRMAELWSESQGRRFFGFVSAGGSLGGLVGPLLARNLASMLSLSHLVWISALLLTGSAILLFSLAKDDKTKALAVVQPQRSQPSALRGLSCIVRSPFLLGVAGLVCLGSFLGMVVYIEMARLVGLTFENAAQRTAFYASRDLWVNAVSFVLQLVLVGQVTKRLGVGAALWLSAMIALVCFVSVGLSPTLLTLTVASVVLRCSEFGLAKPARDMLYTVLPSEEKYQSKNIIDTAIARGSDMTSGWIQSLIGRLGMGLAAWGWLAALIAATLGGLALTVGRGYRARGGR